MERPFPSMCYGKRAFTLLQLLAVVAIMAVLVALFLPAVGSVRQSARQVGCVSHLRQVGIALNAYATDHRNRYPATYGPLRQPPDRETWMAKLAPYAGLGPHEIGNAPVPRTNGIFVCPAFSREEWERRETSYRYNSTMVSVWAYDRQAIPFGKVFMVVETEGVNTELFNSTNENVARRHPGNAANFLFTDGRVETYRTTIPPNDLRWGHNRNANYGL